MMEGSEPVKSSTQGTRQAALQAEKEWNKVEHFQNAANLSCVLIIRRSLVRVQPPPPKSGNVFNGLGKSPRQERVSSCETVIKTVMKCNGGSIHAVSTSIYESWPILTLLFDRFDRWCSGRLSLHPSKFVKQIDCVSEVFGHARRVKPENISSGMPEELVDDLASSLNGNRFRFRSLLSFSISS